jgi:hypothetical protein
MNKTRYGVLAKKALQPLFNKVSINKAKMVKNGYGKNTINHRYVERLHISPKSPKVNIG